MREATVPMPVPLARGLPSIAPGRARWSRVMHDRRLPALLGHGGLAVDLHEAPSLPAGRVFTLDLCCGGAAVQVELAHAHDPALAMATAPAVAAPVRQLAVQTLFGSAAVALDALGLGEWGAADVSLPADTCGSAASPWLEVQREGVRLATLRVVQAPEALCEALLERLRAAQPPRRARTGWRLAARVVVHRQRHGVDLLSSLGPGDVLLLRSKAAGGALAVTVHWGHAAGMCLVASGTLDAGRLTIQGAPVMHDDNDEPESAPAADAPDALGQLDLPVRFEVDTVTMALADIEAIGPGYVIELATPLEAAAIRLVACGQVIGHAELVAVGEHLGARITRMVAR